MTDEQQAIERERDATIATFCEQREQAQRQLDAMSGMLVEHNWIVECDELALTFDTSLDESGRRIAINPRVASPQQCVRFTEVDAINVAASVTNGRGTVGKPILLRDALLKQIAGLDRCIAMLEHYRPAK